MSREIDIFSRLDERPYEGPLEKPHRIRKSPIKLRPRNPERAARAFEEDFGPHADFIRTLPCIISRLHPRLRTECHGRIVACHFQSRGAGGNRFSLFPGCERHHDEAHDGIVSFQERYELDLAKEVEVLNIADHVGLTDEEREAARLRLAKLKEPR